MILLDGIDFDEILTVYCMWQNIFGRGRKWARLWFGSYEKIKIEKNVKKTKKTKIIEYDGS